MVEIIFEIAPLQTLILVVIGFNAPRPCFQVRLSVYPRQLFSACKKFKITNRKMTKGNFLLVDSVESFLQICLHACIVWRGLFKQLRAHLKC